MVFLPEKTLGATDFKLGMLIQLHSGSNMGWVPLGHTSFFTCVQLQLPKNGISATKNTKGVRPMNPYIFGINIIFGMF